MVRPRAAIDEGLLLGPLTLLILSVSAVEAVLARQAR